jgi:hypothetical protein
VTHRDLTLGNDDLRIVVELATEMEAEYTEGDEMWEGSPFRWIKSRPSRQVGKIGEELVAGWCSGRGFKVRKSGNSDADRIVEGHRVEIKFSTLWTDNKIYKFQQIRDQEYDFCFCLGVSPFDVHAWFIPKSELRESRAPSLVPQHGGAEGLDTKWLSFQADSPPAWLSPFGGTLNQVASLIAAAGIGTH